MPTTRAPSRTRPEHHAGEGARRTPTPASTTTSRWSSSIDRRQRRPATTMPFWQLTSVDPDGTAAGEMLFGYGNSSLRGGIAALRPKTGASVPAPQ
ncbi:hypothetical protein HBB16_17205 [Pseudonocardia sp. MCCB 268]|nr:hypothetical protein [Pseudonocardia cytotoxica]